MLAQSLGPSDSFFAYPNEFRKMIYTTHAIDRLQMQFRKVLKPEAISQDEQRLSSV